MRKEAGLPAQAGFIKLIIIIVIALLLLKYFGLTITGIMNSLGITGADITGWIKQAVDWFKELFNSVR